MKIIEATSRDEIENLKAKGNLSKEIEVSVGLIINDVFQNGDEALKQYALKFDGLNLDEIVVCKKRIQRGIAKVSLKKQQAIKTAKENIEKFHKEQMPKGPVENRHNF